MAEWNPAFDPEKPYDEMIIWYPDGLERLESMDETDARADQSKRGKSQATRSLIINQAGSRHGHSKAKPGRKPKGAIQKKQRAGYRGGSKKSVARWASSLGSSTGATRSPPRARPRLASPAAHAAMVSRSHRT
eukprot:5827843-Prymnesium_polylepis.2